MKDFLVDILHAKENSRPRSTQVQIGPSELGGCRRKVWYRLNDQPHTNDNELKLAAIMGTAIHASIENALATADPAGKKYVVEQEVEYGDMKAHIDLWIPETGDVVDWKTVKKSNLSYFPSTQQRWQVQVYGYLLEKSGKGKPVNVNLVAIARDGDERDIKVHSEAYDPKVAEEALNWLAAIKEATEAPEPEKDENYCKFYCKFYDASGELGCVGLKKGNGKGLEENLIDNPEADTAALLYLQLDNQIKELESKKDSIKEQLEGVSGVTTSGISISWTQVAGRKTVDTKALEDNGVAIPYKEGKESVRLNIKQTGGK
jgi:hypothetical protein